MAHTKDKPSSYTIGNILKICSSALSGMKALISAILTYLLKYYPDLISKQERWWFFWTKETYTPLGHLLAESIPHYLTVAIHWLEVFVFIYAILYTIYELITFPRKIQRRYYGPRKYPKQPVQGRRK